MKLSRRGKRTKCTKRTKRTKCTKRTKRTKCTKRTKRTKNIKCRRNTKRHLNKYKRKNTYRKHSHKLGKNKRVMRGGVGEYDFILDSERSTPGMPVYNSSGLLTYRRDKAFTNKTKEFTMTLSYNDYATKNEKLHEQFDDSEKFKKLSPHGGNGEEYDSELRELNRNNPLTSNNVERKVCAVFKLEMTSNDDKKTKFVVYFKLDTAIAETKNGEYLKAFVTYALYQKFSSLPTIIQTKFMKIDYMSPSLTVFPLFNNAVTLVIPDDGSTDSDKNCTFSFKDNSDFFSRLTYTMVKYAADIKYEVQKKYATTNEDIKNARRSYLYPDVFPPQQPTVLE
jgi:hypothetical protein